MVVFITNSDNHNFSGITLDERNGLKRLFKFLDKKRKEKSLVGYDYETNGLCNILNQPLLLALGDKNQQFVIDCHTVDMQWLPFYDDLKYIGHNIKFDIGFSMYHFKSKANNLLCTEIIDRKLFQNNKVSKSNPNGYRYGLVDVMQRHLGFIPPETDKTVRDYFIGLKPHRACFNDKHIYYAGGDIKYLEDIYIKQMEYAKKFNLDWWLHTVECPLISVLAECELNGFVPDVKSWKAIIKENEKLQFDYACQLDAEFRKLRNTLSTGDKLLVGGVWDRLRNLKPQIQYNTLFGEVSKDEFMQVKGYNKKDPNANIQWTPDTVLTILATLKIPAPLQGEAFNKYGYLIPILHKGKLVKHVGYTIEGEGVEVPDYAKQNEGWTCGQKAWQRYLVDFPNSPIRDFIDLYVKYSKVTTELTNFGQNYLDKINPVTKRWHTLYRQMHTVNGRLQSGGGKDKKKDGDVMTLRYNSQNIPRGAKFRNCFLGGTDVNGKPYSVVTCDLNGAEVTIMCDKANDVKFYEWAVINDDSHSPMVQNVWRYIYLYRAGVLAKEWSNFNEFKVRHLSKPRIKKLEDSKNPKVIHWYNLHKTFIVTKKINKPYRQAGKNGTFGGVYGMKPKKAAETFNGTDTELAKSGEPYEPVNVTIEEGKVIIYAQKKAIPKTYAMVESVARKGMLDGYCILNDRSHSRIWLPEVIRLKQAIYADLKKAGLQPCSISYDSYNGYEVYSTGETYQLDWRNIKDYEGQLRNTPISGTQADCVKEAMVEIAKYIRHNELDKQGVALLSQVHDELVYRCPKYMDGQSDDWHTPEFRTSVVFTFDNPISISDYETKYKDEHCLMVYNQEDSIDSVRCSFPKFVQLTMIQCANRFLKNFEMKASFDVLDCWTK